MQVNAIVDNVGVKAAFSAGNYAYLQIPTNSLRGFFDALFPSLAKNATADVARGFGHRWVAGHDLLIDVPKTIVKGGTAEGAKQAGHILLTDFPTKAGIPIPGLSSSGLGRFLTESCKIPKGYLCLNIMDTAVGILAMTEGTFDLFNVIAANLRMSPKLFIDTFVEGSAEIIAGAYCENPLLLIAGAEQVAAGAISTFHTITHPLWYVNPLSFFSGCLSGGITSLVISKLVLKKNNTECLKDATQSCVLGALFSISTCFGIGGIIALIGCGLGKFMADKDNKSQRLYLKISENELIRLQAFSRSLIDNEDTARWWFFEKFSASSTSELLPASYKEIRISDLLLPESQKKTFCELLGFSVDYCAISTISLPKEYLSPGNLL